jgi:hypothetical protein
MTGDAEADALLDHYLAALANTLGGPPAVREAVVAELRDGLLETFDTQRRLGLQPAEAAWAAIRLFGEVPAVCQAFAPEVAAVQARTLALRLLGTGPVVGTVWLLALTTSQVHIVLPFQGRESVWRLFPLVGVVLTVTVAAGLCAIAATGRLGRRLPVDSQLGLRAAVLTGAGAVLVDLGMATLVLAQAVSTPGLLIPLPLLAAVTVSLVRLRLAAPATRRCLAAQRALPG